MRFFGAKMAIPFGVQSGAGPLAMSVQHHWSVWEEKGELFSLQNMEVEKGLIING